MAEKTFNSRIIHKHDVAENWQKATNFTPKQGEIIVYDRDENYNYERFKIGDGVTLVNELPFVDESFIVSSVRVTHGDNVLSNILETYILNINYDSALAFDTTEIIFDSTDTTSVLGRAILGRMVLA